MALVSDLLLVWIKRRRGRGAVSSVNIEMQPRDQLLSSSSTTEEQGFPQEIRIGTRISFIVSCLIEHYCTVI